MLHAPSLPLLGILATLSTWGQSPEPVSTAAPAPVLTRTMTLPGVEKTRSDVGVPGRIDHLTYDPATQRLFVAALENGSLEVLDLEQGVPIKSIAGLERPQGLTIATSVHCAVVACGGGAVHVFDTHSLAEVQCIPLGGGADNARYDPAADEVYITHGNQDGGAVSVLDPRSWKILRTVPFKHRPESFQLDPGGARLFANIPAGLRAITDGQVAVIDRKQGTAQAAIRLAGRARNYPMAFDAEHERLFVVSRRPPRLIEIDTRKYEVVTEAACMDDSDDLFFDALTNRVLVIGGGYRPDFEDTPPAPGDPARDETGAIDVFAVGPRGELTKVAYTPTAPHARTGCFVPQRRALYVAVPQRAGRAAEIREYHIPE